MNNTTSIEIIFETIKELILICVAKNIWSVEKQIDEHVNVHLSSIIAIEVVIS